jgi:glycosyltransferase involved in cell wall biosynthesis
VAPGLAARTGGQAMSIVGFCNALEPRGFESVVFSTDLAGPASASAGRPVRRDELPDGAEGLDVRLFPVRTPRRLAFSPALQRAFRLELARADLVHVHSLWLHPQIAAARLAARASVPYVISPHGTLDPSLHARGRMRKAATNLVWQHRMFDAAAAIHFATATEAELARDTIRGRPVIVAPNPIDCDRLAQLPPAAEFRRSHLGGATGPVVLSLGRIAAHKQLHVLVEAFAIATKNASARLVIAGPDDEGLTARLTRLGASLGVADRVVFTGPLYGRTKLAALAAADLFALPSRSENFGIAVAEALAAGVPALVSPGVNIAAELAGDEAAIVAEATPAAFAAALTALIADADLRGRLGDRGQAHARRYDAAHAGALLAAGYDKALRTVAHVAPLEVAAHA